MQDAHDPQRFCDRIVCSCGWRSHVSGGDSTRPLELEFLQHLDAYDDFSRRHSRILALVRMARLSKTKEVAAPAPAPDPQPQAYDAALVRMEAQFVKTTADNAAALLRIEGLLVQYAEVITRIHELLADLKSAAT